MWQAHLVERWIVVNADGFGLIELVSDSDGGPCATTMDRNDHP